MNDNTYENDPSEPGRTPHTSLTTDAALSDAADRLRSNGLPTFMDIDLVREAYPDPLHRPSGDEIAGALIRLCRANILTAFVDRAIVQTIRRTPSAIHIRKHEHAGQVLAATDGRDYIPRDHVDALIERRNVLLSFTHSAGEF